MITTIDDITCEVTGRTIKIYPVYNPADVVMQETYANQTEALTVYMKLIEDM